MRAGWNGSLEQVTRTVPMTAQLGIEAQVVARKADGTEMADIRQRADQWTPGGPGGGLDSVPANVEILPDGGVRLKATANNGPVNSTVTAYSRASGDAGAVSPYIDPVVVDNRQHFVAWVEWNGSEGTGVELGQVNVWLNPQFDLSIAKTVAYWQLELYAVVRIDQNGAIGSVPLLAAPTKVSADGQAAGFVPFDFTNLASRPRPKAVVSAGGVSVGGVSVPGFRGGLAHTLVVVTGRQKDGSRASNIGWGFDGAHSTAVSGAGSTLYGAQLKANSFLNLPGIGTLGLTNTVPAIQLILGTHTPATVSFSDTGVTNHLDLGSVPSTAPELVVRSEVPAGTTVQAQVFDGATWKNYTDGDIVASKNNAVGQSGNDLTSVAVQQTYKVRATLTQNATGDRAPILRALGVRVVTITDFSDVCEVVSVTEAVDPQDLHAEVPEVMLRALHDGDRDFRDAITLLLANNPIGNITFRLWHRHPKLSRGLWLHRDDYFIDDYDLGGPSVTLHCLSPLALVRGVLPVLTTEQDFFPSADGTNPGAWTKSGGSTAPFYTLLADNNGGTGFQPWDDSTYIVSPASPSDAQINFTLPTTGAPNANLGPNLNVIVQFRYALEPPGNTGRGSIKVTLFKGAGGLANTIVFPNSTQVVTGTLQLTAAQIALLGDGSSLSLQFSAGVAGFVGPGQVRVTWARLVFLPLRAALVYPSPTSVGTVAQDLLASQIALDGRYRGPSIVDVVPPLGVGKTISAPANGSSPDLTIAKGELDAIGYIAGVAWISSQGRVKAVSYFDVSVDATTGAVTYTPHQAAPVAVIPREEIAEPISVTPGYRYRVPLFDVWWGWNDATQAWQGEAHGVSLSALNALGQARLVANRQLADRIAKWVQSQGLANGLAQRQVLSLGLGQLVWRFRTTYAHPELELGDPVAIETDRFIAYDPTAAKAIAGAQWVTGYVVGIFEPWGRELVIWVPTYSSLGAEGGAQVSSQAPAPNPAALVLNVQTAHRAGGYLVVSWSGGPAVKSVRLAYTTAGTGDNAPPLAPGELTAAGAAPTARTLGTSGTPFGAAAVDVAGLGGSSSRLMGGGAIAGAPPAGAGVVLVGQSGQTQIGPYAFADLIYVTVTPYPTVDGTGSQGPVVSLQVRYLADAGEHDPVSGLRPRNQPLIDGRFAAGASQTDGSQFRCKAHPSASINVATGSNVAVALDVDDFNVGGIHDTVTNNSRFTIPPGGGGLPWLFVAQTDWDNNTTGTREVFIRKNLGGSIATLVVPANIFNYLTVAGIDIPAVGDFYEMVVTQDSGTTRTLDIPGLNWFLAVELT